MTTPTLYPTYIDRQWEIHDAYSIPFTSKIMTFYWNHTDDHAYDWIANGQIPWVWNDGVASNSGNYNVTTLPHYTQAYIDDVTASGIYRIGVDIENPLPVELSSFTAAATYQNFVRLDWITQSETGVLGFYIYRSEDTNLNHAIVVSPLIDATNSPQTQSYSFTDTEVEAGTYYYWLQNMDLDAAMNFFGYVAITIVEGGDTPPPVIPDVTGLEVIFPNPFNPNTTVTYNLAKDETVNIAVYNIKGQLISTLLSGLKQSGIHHISWTGKDDNGNPMPSGIYYVKMTAGKYVKTQKIVLMK